MRKAFLLRPLMTAVALLALWALPSLAWSLKERPLPQGAVSDTGTGEGVVSTRWLEEALREEVFSALEWDRAMVELHDFRWPENLQLARMPAFYSVVSPERVSSGQRVSLAVIFRDRAHRFVGQLRVSAKVELYGYVWVLGRSVRTGEILRPENVSRQRRTIRQIPPEALQDPRAVLGQSAKRSLLAGTILQEDQWRRRPVVRRRQQVRILLETGLLRVAAPGMSLEEGGRGDRVRVLNLSSKKVVLARVRDTGTVVVEF